MKILLFGDFSNYHVFLADGLKKLGHQAIVFSEGDDFKKTHADVNRKKSGCFSFKDFLQCRKLIKEADIVQYINPQIIGRNIPLWLWLFFTRSKFKRKFFLAIVGTDYVFEHYGRKYLSLPLFNELDKFSKQQSYLRRFIKKRMNMFMLKSVIGVVGWCEYCEAYKDFSVNKLMVFQPINLDKYKYEKRYFGGKLKLFHAIPKGREVFKGSYHIKQAFDTLAKIYPQELEFIIVENLPFNEFIKKMNEADIVFDQTNFHSFGMNALGAMACGKIACCGTQDDKFWDKWSKDLNLIEKPPVIPIKPDSDFIVEQVKWMLENRNALQIYAQRSRAYVEKFHRDIDVAKKVVAFWKLCGTKAVT